MWHAHNRIVIMICVFVRDLDEDGEWEMMKINPGFDSFRLSNRNARMSSSGAAM